MTPARGLSLRCLLKGSSLRTALETARARMSRAAALTGLAATVIAPLALGSCGKDVAQPSQANPEVIRFSVLSAGSSRTAGQYWRPILADLAAQTGLKVEPYYSDSYPPLVEAMRLKKTDAGWFSNESGLQVVRRGGGEVFARTFGANGGAGDTSVLIVNAKSSLTLDKALKCDRRLSLGLGDALSTSGAMAPVAYLFAPRNIDPKACFHQVRAATQAANLLAVANGQVDVATISSASLTLAAQAGRPEAGEVKVVWRSPPLPEDPIIWRKTLDPVVKEKLRQFFLTYGQGDNAQAARQRGNLARLNVAGFEPADDNHLLPVREMEAAEAWISAKQSHDTARIAAAQKGLDNIRAQREALEGRTRAPAAAQ